MVGSGGYKYSQVEVAWVSPSWERGDPLERDLQVFREVPAFAQVFLLTRLNYSAPDSQMMHVTMGLWILV